MEQGEAPAASMSGSTAQCRNAWTPATGEGSINVVLYEDEVPDFVQGELERLYGNVYSSLQQLRANNGLTALTATSTYAEWRNGALCGLLLFRREGNQVRVLNEGIVLDEDELQRFSSCIFGRDRHVGCISFHAIRPSIHQLPYPYQRFNCLEDIVLAMPSSTEEYLASLGGSTRSYIKRYLSKLRRDFPAFEHAVHERGDIDEQHVKDIVSLNRQRMSGKGKTSGIDARDLDRIIRLAKECGMLSMVTIGGRVCAGTINYRIGNNYFLDVIGHDPAYNDYRLGTLGCYLTICECIRRGGHEYHFLWGRHDYKFRLLGQQRDLDHLTIFRSRTALLRHAAAVAGNWRMSAMRKAQLWLYQAQREDSGIGRTAINVLQQLRKLTA